MPEPKAGHTFSSEYSTDPCSHQLQRKLEYAFIRGNARFPGGIRFSDEASLPGPKGRAFLYQEKCHTPCNAQDSRNSYQGRAKARAPVRAKGPSMTSSREVLEPIGLEKELQCQRKGPSPERLEGLITLSSLTTFQILLCTEGRRKLPAVGQGLRTT